MCTLTYRNPQFMSPGLIQLRKRFQEYLFLEGKAYIQESL